MWNQIFPERASSVAGDVDLIFTVVTGLSFFFSVVVAVLIVVFAIRYRRTKPAARFVETHEGRGAGATWVLEASWIVVLLVLSLSVFGWGARLYVRMAQLPANAMDVYVVGKQWMWKFQHPTGQTEIDELHVPVNFPVRLTMISEDVIHSFYVPAFRVKQDVIPGQYTTTWFEATQPGEYHLFCAEYCGTDHSRMIGRVVVLEPTAYQQWLSGRAIGGGTGAIPEDQGRTGTETQTASTMTDAGGALFESLGCHTCHREDNSGTGPSLVERWGGQVPLEDGQEITFDENYVRTSILDPQAHIHAGYPPVMPTFEGQIDESELLQLIEYIRSLSGTGNEGAGAAATPEQSSGQVDAQSGSSGEGQSSNQNQEEQP